MTIENTRKREPIEHLGGMLIQGQSAYIENMERAGGQQMLVSDVLPKEMSLHGQKDAEERGRFEALGFVFGEPVDGDPMFIHATLPPGWTRKPGENPYGYWTYIVDERGLERVAIFYKAAFYDRGAHMRLTQVGSQIASKAIYDPAIEIPWNLLSESETADAVAGLNEYLESVKRHPDIYGERESRARELLASKKG